MSPNQGTGGRFSSPISLAAMSGPAWAGVVGEMLTAIPDLPPTEDVIPSDAAPNRRVRSIWSELSAGLGLAHLWMVCLHLIRLPEGETAVRADGAAPAEADSEIRGGRIAPSTLAGE